LIFRRNSCFRALIQNPTRSVDIGEIWRGKLEILENAYEFCRYVIDITGLDPLSLEELGGGVHCLDEFGTSGRAKTMKIGRRVRELHKLT